MRRLLAVLTVIVPTVVPSVLHAQPAPAGTKVTVAPQLRTALASKKKVDAAQVAAAFHTDANGPFIRVGARDFRLLDTSARQVRKVSGNQVTVPAFMNASMAAIQRWSPGVVPQYAVAHVDHRSGQTPIRDQMARGTCSAFAAVAGLESLVRRRAAAPAATGVVTAVPSAVAPSFQDASENHAFNRALEIMGRTCDDGGVQTWASTQAAIEGLCAEPAFPYTPSACPPAGAPPACASGLKVKINSVYSMQTPNHEVPDLPNDVAHRADNITLLESFLANGKDIIFAVDVAGSTWNTDTKSGVVDVTLEPNGDPSPARGAHAMLMVGYDHNDRYFIMKNSWGPAFGRDGYLYMSFDYVQTYAWYGFAVLD